MRIVEQSAEIFQLVPEEMVMAHLTMCGNICYKSKSPNPEKFVKKLIADGHESVLEHISVTAHVITDRAIGNEIVRHRLAAYSQESTRFCNYGSERFDGHISFIQPDAMRINLVGESGFAEAIANRHSEVLSQDEMIWLWACGEAEKRYYALIKEGWTAQNARDVLPLDLKTEIMMTYNLREWRHFFNLRAIGTTGTPHPKMRKLAIMLFMQMYEYLPVVFADQHNALFFDKSAGC